MSTDQPTPEQIEADIERQREHLAETVDALHHRLDVKAQTQAKAADLKDRATTDGGAPRPELVAAGAAALAGVTLLIRRRRR